MPPGGSWIDIFRVTLETLAGIALLGFAFQGRFLKKSTVLETVLFTLSGLLLVFPELIETVLGAIRLSLPHPHVVAMLVAVGVTLMQRMRSVHAPLTTR